MAEEPQSRFDTDTDTNTTKRKLDEIQIAKQKAQELVARFVNDAESKRPRLEDAAAFPIPTANTDSHRPPLEFSQKPFNQSTTNPAFGSVPSMAQPTPNYNFQATSKRIDIPNGKVGVVIGKAGETIKYLQLQSGARIQVTRDADADPTSQTREVELMGTSEQISRAEKLIQDVIAESDAAGSGTTASQAPLSVQHGPEQFSMKVPNNKVALIIGKGGETIKNMQSRSGARIQVIPLHLPPGDVSTERNIYVNGTKEQIELAKELLNEIISQNRVRNPTMSGGYMQQNYPTPGNWAPPGSNPVQQAGYGYAQSGTTPSPYYSNYPPQPAGWDQATPPAAAPLPQQSAGYNYYGQQSQTGSAPANVNYGYAQPLPATGYGYDQGYSQQQQAYGNNGSQGEEDPHSSYISPGYGAPGATPGKSDGTTTSQPFGTQTPTPMPAQPIGTPSTQPSGTPSTPLPQAQSIGSSTPQPYATQFSTPMPPGQPVAYGQQPAAPTGYMPPQNYPGYPSSQAANVQMGYSQMGYGGQQPLQIPPSTSQTGYVQSGYPQPALTQSGYAQGANTSGYGMPQPATHLQPQPVAYGSERSTDGNATVGNYSSTPATQETVHPQS